ncbi:MAG: hypothetical protein EOP40_03125 [Rubrivivax sp.]|nr:MAG: hypothetical protein EOP40_03125 [Rubrivivax sp.]
MEIKLHQLDTFPVRDAQGAARTVKAYERLARVHTLLDERAQWEPTGIVEFRLDSGEAVTADADGSLSVAATGQRLELRRPLGEPGQPAQRH